MKRLGSETGVAMIIVLLVGASLTAVSSVATFAMIREFGSGDDDRKSAQALAAAEAGIDRFLAYLRSGKVTYGLLNQAGCNGNPALTLPSGSVGAGSYSASITVYNPNAVGAAQFPPAACTPRPTRPVLGQDGVGNTWFVITSRGTFAEATKVIVQTVALQPIGLPVGIYGRSITVQSANHDFPTVTMVSETTIQNRENLEFEGLDPWYVMKNLYPDPGGDLTLANVTGAAATAPVPAAAHAAGTIFLGNANRPEYPPSSNCTANGKGGASAAQRAQSIWDSDGSGGSGAITAGCAAWPGIAPVGGGAGVHPNTSKFTADQLATFASPRLSEEDYQTLKDAAKVYGVYCSYPGAGDPTGTKTCIRAGTTVTGNGAGAPHYFEQVKILADAGEKNILGYVEYRTGAVEANNLLNSADLGATTVWGCNDDPDLSKSLTTIVRRGGVDYSGAGGDFINGAFILDGNWKSGGGLTFNGSLVVQGNLHFQSASEEYSLNTCWVNNTPGPFFRVVAGAWSEIDR